MKTGNGLISSGGLLALLCISALVYWPGLNGPLILDDVANLDILRKLAEQERLSAANLLAERGGWLGSRPVSWLSFLWSWHIAPGDVWVFKLHNLLLHLLNGVLVFSVTRLLLQRVEHDPGQGDTRMALLVCALWLLAPIQVSSVLYLVQRMTLLAATFVLLGILCFCVGRRWANSRPTISFALVAFALVVCWPLATLSKETGALLPILLLVAEVFVGLGPDNRSPWSLKILCALSAAILLAGMARTIWDPGWIVDVYELRNFTLSERLLTQPRVIIDYAQNVLNMPGGSELGLFHDDFVVSKSLWSPASTLPAFVFIVAILSVSWRMRASESRLFFFGLTFFVVAHCLEAGPFALEMYFEHRNYLPSLGLWISFAAGLSLLMARWSHRWLWPFLVSLVLFLNAIGTFNRVLSWTSWDGIVTSNARAHPQSLRARASLAARALGSGNLDVGLRELSAVARIGGSSVDAAVILKSFAGHCVAERRPETWLYQRLADLGELHDDPYTISALKWFAETAESGRCKVMDLQGVAKRLELLADKINDNPYFGYRWMRDESVARINAAAGYRATAIRLFRRAARRAPSSDRAVISARVEQLKER